METAAFLFSIQTQPLPSSLYCPKLCLSIPTSSPSPHILFFPIPSAGGRAPSAVSRAEPPEAGDGPKSVDPSPLPKKPGERGAGFGAVAADEKKKMKGKGRSNVVRRFPIDRPAVFSASGEESGSSKGKQGANEGSFVLAWLGLGFLILIEGVALAASGFLPEQWDSFFVKYLYPSFTPTVAVFIGGTVVYSVLKYLQAEKMKG